MNSTSHPSFQKLESLPETAPPLAFHPQSRVQNQGAKRVQRNPPCEPSIGHTVKTSHGCSRDEIARDGIVTAPVMGRAHRGPPAPQDVEAPTSSQKHVHPETNRGWNQGASISLKSA